MYEETEDLINYTQMYHDEVDLLEEPPTFEAWLAVKIEKWSEE